MRVVVHDRHQREDLTIENVKQMVVAEDAVGKYRTYIVLDNGSAFTVHGSVPPGLYVDAPDEDEFVPPPYKGMSAPELPDDDSPMIETLTIPTRPYNALKRAGYGTINQILAVPPKQLLAIPNFGRGSLNELMRELEALGHVLENGYWVR